MCQRTDPGDSAVTHCCTAFTCGHGGSLHNVIGSQGVQALRGLCSFLCVGVYGLGDLRTPLCPALTTIAHVQDHWSLIGPGACRRFCLHMLSLPAGPLKPLLCTVSPTVWVCDGSWSTTPGAVVRGFGLIPWRWLSG